MVKKRYYVGNTAEGENTGEIWLTEEQAEIVAYATNPANWSNRGGDGWGGSFYIKDADEEDELLAAEMGKYYAYANGGK